MIPTVAGGVELQTGSSLIEREGATLALHIPSALKDAHGPSGVFIFIGGMGDSAERYQKQFSSVADKLEIVVIVPEMPWFKDAKKNTVPTVFKALETTVKEMKQQLSMDPNWIFIGGASAGGKAATDLASKWSSNTNLLLLASTGPFPDVRRIRTLHVVAENEIERLGSRTRGGTDLGRGQKDMFVIPGAKHSAQIPHLRSWLETEVSVLRMENANTTLSRAESALRSDQPSEAKSILQSTLEAAKILGTSAGDSDDFFKYETQRRVELLSKYSNTIQKLREFEAGL